MLMARNTLHEVAFAAREIIEKATAALLQPQQQEVEGAEDPFADKKEKMRRMNLSVMKLSLKTATWPVSPASLRAREREGS